MATDLYEDFSPPSEISDVRNKLRTNNRIVLTGCRGSAYFQTALYAVKDMKYNLDRCVRLTDASTWNHIDPDEVDMVLFKHPFGESALDKGKLRAMLDVFKSILDTTKDSSKRLDVITVSREDILKQAQHLIGRDHDLFDINVQLYKENNEENPEDLVTETLMLDTTEPTDQPLKNLLEMSETHFRRSPSTRCQDRIIYTAKSNIRMHKTVVLAGTSKLAIDSLVLALVTSYSPNQRLLLTNPDNLVHVQLTKISLLIIDSFTGKYKYDSTKTHKWFEAFDTLLALVQDGKLNIIITAESQAFKRCLEEYGNHELLQHVVEVNESDISSDVKQDTTNGDNQQAEDVGQIDIIRVFHSTPDSDATEGSAILSNTTPMHINDIELTGVISGLTVVDDEYLVTSSVYPDSNGSTLTCISQKTLLKVSNLSIGHRVSGITTVDRNRVAVALRFAGVIMFIGISNKGHLSILAADELRVDKRCYGIVSGQNNRYLMASYIDSVENSNASFVEQMDTKGTVLNTFRTDSTGRPFNEPFALTLSGHNACTYVSDFGNNTLSALMENGDVAAVTSVDRPTDVAAGADGCVYVCCPNYNTVLQWSPQSGTLITLLDERNGVKEPECVTFCTQSRKLYVGMANVAVSKIKVYQMRNNPR